MTCMSIAQSTTLDLSKCSGNVGALTRIAIPSGKIEEYSFFAPLIQLNRRATEATTTDSDSSTSTSSRTSSSTTSSSGGASSTSGTDRGAASGSDMRGGGDPLSDGAKAGIGIGAALAVIALAVIAVALWVRHRKKRLRRLGLGGGMMQGGGYYGEYPAFLKPPSELATPERPSELPPTRDPAEMQGDYALVGADYTAGAGYPGGGYAGVPMAEETAASGKPIKGG